MANYNYSSTASGQGNWNTGGVHTGSGSLANGIRGTSSRYNVGVSTPKAAPRPMVTTGVQPGTGALPTAPTAPAFAATPFTPPPSYAGADNVSALQEYLNQVGQPRAPTPFGYKDYPSRTEPSIINGYPPSRTGPSFIGQGQTQLKSSAYPPAGRTTIAPAGNYGNDQFGTTFGNAVDRNRSNLRGRAGMGFGGGGGGGF